MILFTRSSSGWITERPLFGHIAAMVDLGADGPCFDKLGMRGGDVSGLSVVLTLSLSKGEDAHDSHRRRSVNL